MTFAHSTPSPGAAVLRFSARRRGRFARFLEWDHRRLPLGRTGRLKTMAWGGISLLVHVFQAVARLAGRVRRVDVLIYKVDRLGDWLLAEPSVLHLVREARARQLSVVIWASRESSGLRTWRPPECAVETLAFEPRGWLARLKRMAATIRLLSVYQADMLVCLRHAPDPIRDFVFRTVRAPRKHALTWRRGSARSAAVPYEILRHHWVLESAGFGVHHPASLLPHLAAPADKTKPHVVLAPFSSARVKDWSDAAWATVLSTLTPTGLEVEIWVGPDQVGRARSLADLARQNAGGAPPVSVRTGSLADLATAVGTAPLVLTVDTLAAHLAAATDVPMVALLGGGHYGDFAPWTRSTRQRWLTHPLPCFQCDWQCTRARNDCVQLIPPEAVIAEMKSLLEPGFFGPRLSPSHPSAGHFPLSASS